MKKLVLILFIAFTPISSSLADEKTNFTFEEHLKAVKEKGYYQVTSDCEEEIKAWQEENPVPQCVFDRLDQIFDNEDMMLKRKMFEAYCYAESAEARKHPNYKATEFFGSEACQHTYQKAVHKARKSSTLPKYEDFKEKEACLKVIDTWKWQDPLPECVVRDMKLQLQDLRNARK